MKTQNVQPSEKKLFEAIRIHQQLLKLDHELKVSLETDSLFRDFFKSLSEFNREQIKELNALILEDTYWR